MSKIFLQIQVASIASDVYMTMYESGYIYMIFYY